MHQTRTQNVPPFAPTRRRRRWKSSLCLGGILLLGGCAGAKVENLSMATPHTATAPTSLGVEVALAPGVETDAVASKAAQALQAGLVKAYQKAGLKALPVAAAAPAPGTATVRVHIRRADPGDRLARLLIGFGAGRSSLRTDATFLMAGEASPSMRFSASARSGHKPGVILPGAIAAATGEVSRVAIGGGVGLLLEGRSGLDDQAKKSAKAIVKQTRALYRSSGWIWPSEVEPETG